MRWEGGRESGEVEDRRGLGPVGVGGIGVGGVVLALIGYFVFGVDPQQTLSAVGGAGQPAQEQHGVVGAPSDREGRFVDVIASSTTDVWTKIFAARGQRYTPYDKVVLYDQATPTGCGTGQAAMGPFYCPRDGRVYLDLSFWNELSGRFGAPGDFAKAYVIAHEVGHNVQAQLGADKEAQRLGSRGAQSGSVRLELQADCYAGVWANHVGEVSGGKVALDPGDVDQGLTAASAVGDDTLQKQTQGQVVPDSFTHGSSAQRMRWFKRGYDTGDMDQCDTFGAGRL